MSKKGKSMGGNNLKLTKKEEVILDLANSGDYSIKDISKYTNKSMRTVYRYIRNIKQKGWEIKPKTKMSQKGGHISQKCDKFWRYHNLHFLCKPYYFYPRYKKYLGTINLKRGNWLISIHKDVVEFRLRAKIDFRDTDLWNCSQKARRDFNKCLAYTSNKIGFEYSKDNKSSLKCVNGHIAQVKGDISVNLKGKPIHIRGDDGLIWFEIDLSTGELEEEYRHPKHHINHAEMLKPHLNAMVDPKSMTVLELQESLNVLVNNQVRYAENINSHINAIQLLGKSVQELTDAVKKRDRKINKLEARLNQRTLKDWR